MKKLLKMLLCSLILVVCNTANIQDESSTPTLDDEKIEVFMTKDKMLQAGFEIDDTILTDNGSTFSMYSDIAHGYYTFIYSKNSGYSLNYMYNDNMLFYNSDAEVLEVVLDSESGGLCTYDLVNRLPESETCTDTDIVKAEALELRFYTELDEIGITFEELIMWAVYTLDKY